MTLQEALTILITFQLWRISDDEVHIQKPSEVTNALDVLLNHCVGTLELPQQEISDKEIKEATKEYLNHLNVEFKNLALISNSFISGCVWYREQLKTK